MVLDQNPDEALERAEHGAVEHHRRHLVRVLVDIEGAEPPRHVEIDLHGAALPVAADGVAQHVFELGPVEGAFALVERPRAARGLKRLHQRGLGLVPHRVVADALVGAVGELDGDVGEAEILVDREDQVVHRERLGGDLRIGDEHVGVVLREARTRISPCSAPDGSKRCTLPNSASLNGRSR